MKRLVILFFVTLFGMAIFCSCKTSECPAYSKADVIDIEQSA